MNHFYNSSTQTVVASDQDYLRINPLAIPVYKTSKGWRVYKKSQWLGSTSPFVPVSHDLTKGE